MDNAVVSFFVLLFSMQVLFFQSLLLCHIICYDLIKSPSKGIHFRYYKCQCSIIGLSREQWGE